MARVINKISFEANESLLKKCAEETIKEAGGKKGTNFSIVLVSEEEIRGLNEKYYNKKGATDVLTFPSDEDGYAGDIIVCPSFLKGDNIEWELCHVVVHGTMHLLGIHHEDAGDGGHEAQHKKEVEIINKVLNG